MVQLDQTESIVSVYLYSCNSVRSLWSEVGVNFCAITFGAGLYYVVAINFEWEI